MNPLRTVLGVVALALVPHMLLGQETKDTLPPASEGKTWKLVWHDEFDGTALDTDKWVYDPRGNGGTVGGAAKP